MHEANCLCLSKTHKNDRNYRRKSISLFFFLFNTAYASPRVCHSLNAPAALQLVTSYTVSCIFKHDVILTLIGVIRVSHNCHFDVDTYLQVKEKYGILFLIATDLIMLGSRRTLFFAILLMGFFYGWSKSSIEGAAP